MKRFLLSTVFGILISSLALGPVFSATEIRMTGMYTSSGLGVTGDHRLGNTCVTSTGGRTYCGLNASHLSFFADNAVSLERLYQFARVYDNGVNGYCLKSNGDNTFYWGVCGGSTLPWDNITGTDNAITAAKILLDTSGGYTLFLGGVRTDLQHYLDNGTLLGRYALYDSGELYLAGTDNAGTQVGHLSIRDGVGVEIIAYSGQIILQGDVAVVGSIQSDNAVLSGGAISGTTINSTPDSYYDPTSSIQSQLNAKQDALTSASDVEVNSITVKTLVFSGADNTHYNNVKNSASPTGIYLAAGNYWTLPDETMLLRNQDNSATNILASAYQYRNFAFDNSAMDNMVLIQSLPFTEVWDNVIYTVRGYVDGKPTGAATDNVTTNFYYCASSDNTLAQCTKMFTSDPVPTGAATLSPAINNGTCAAGGEIRVSFVSNNLSGKKLNIRARYLRR